MEIHNAKIADDDKVYEVLDKWHDEDKYDEILEKIFEIPREMWSNKLWFRVISAYNNKEEYGKSLEELDKMRPFCLLKEDISKWYYMYAYVYYANNMEVLAVWYLERSLEHNPQYDASLELKEECEEFISSKIKDIRELINAAKECIRERQQDVLKSQELKECEGGEFAALLSFPACLRVVPGISECMGKKAFYKCKDETDKEQAREFLYKVYKISDSESVMEALGRYHCASDFNDFVCFWAGKPNFDTAKLQENALAGFESAKFFGMLIKDYVSETGLYAADLNEMMMTIRIAYACDILSNTEYCRTMMELEDIAKEHYSSWEEYAIDAFCGNAYTVYCKNNMNLRATVKYMRQELVLLPHIDWYYYKFN